MRYQSRVLVLLFASSAKIARASWGRCAATRRTLRAKSSGALHGGAGMKRAGPAIVCIVAAGLLAGCAPLIRFENRSQIGARVMVAQSAGKGPFHHSTGLRIPPRGVYAIEAVEGRYIVFVSADKAWRNYVNEVRIELENELRYPKNLPPEKVRLLTQYLANLLQQYERTYTANRRENGGAPACEGVIGNSEDDVRVLIDTSPSGSFTVSCENSPKKAGAPR
jgi:hypothetical protein